MALFPLALAYCVYSVSNLKFCITSPFIMVMVLTYFKFMKIVLVGYIQRTQRLVFVYLEQLLWIFAYVWYELYYFRLLFYKLLLFILVGRKIDYIVIIFIGFIMMTPQLFINYKLKSVGKCHLISMS